jgi:4-hydroxybenzoate polyprenyltransferase
MFLQSCSSIRIPLSRISVIQLHASARTPAMRLPSINPTVLFRSAASSTGSNRMLKYAAAMHETFYLHRRHMHHGSESTPFVKVRSFLTPYAQLARIDKPIGTYLLFIPCSWAILMNAHALSCVPMLILFGVGSFVMRGWH